MGKRRGCNNPCKALIPPQFCAREAHHVEQGDLNIVDLHALDPLLEGVRGLEPDNHLELGEKAEGHCPCQQDSQTVSRRRPAALHIKKSKRKEIRPMVFRKHPVDLLFAVTYHKLQGLTLNKLILTINKHPNPLLRLVLSSLYVGISPVHSLSEVRVLPYADEDVDYLVKMKFDDLFLA